MAVKAHLNGKYDIVKNRGRIRNCKIDDRNDRFKFEKLSRKDDVRLFVASCLVRRPNMWVGEMVDTDFGDRVYAETKAYVDSATYRLSQDLENLPMPVFSDNLKAVEGRIPILTEYRRRRVSLETVALIDRVFPFIAGVEFSDPLDASRAPLISRYGVLLPIPSTTVRTAVEKIFPNGRR